MRDWGKIEGITKAITDEFLVGIITRPSTTSVCVCVVAIILYIVDVTRKKKTASKIFQKPEEAAAAGHQTETDLLEVDYFFFPLKVSTMHQR